LRFGNVFGDGENVILNLRLGEHGLADEMAVCHTKPPQCLSGIAAPDEYTMPHTTPQSTDLATARGAERQRQEQGGYGAMGIRIRVWVMDNS
jgi:hypothetical protein